MNSLLRDYVREFERGGSFEETNAEPLLDALIESTDETQLSAMFEAWDNKGIEGHEIYSFAKLMRKRCLNLNSRHEKIVDIVGTGGSKAKTFNVSTAAAFVVASAGIPVAKHGNKAATSSTGSADVLFELGIKHSMEPGIAEKCLNAVGICFMFAPNHHRLSPTLANVRRGLGFPTIFNCIGPLCNPAGAQYQLIGVWDKTLITKMADALAKLGTKRSWIVHGGDGLDEISLTSRTFVAEVTANGVREFTIEPSEFGLRSNLNTIRKAESAAESSAMIRQVLSPSEDDGRARDLVLMNAAAGIFVSGFCSDLITAFDIARSLIKSGKAMQKLESFVNFPYL